ncbi:Arabinose operon regulatory protein [bacterium HR17]|jgi:AraC-like DNA-binding protein|uniref:Arabinose operon regulatory protein n=1 Tax=Candidatus Fervidibacter japonicus TaxID=2035412 RepID=A0A2H5XD52_9BACT|nr:Arabinose operon regulatory protein [bacterium HR17]
MAEADKVLSEPERPTIAPMTVVRTDFPAYPTAEALREWNWVWETMAVAFLHARQHECLPHWRIAPRRLPNAILFFVHAGRAKWQVGEISVIAQPHDVLLIPENVVHAAEHMPERRFCVSAVHFTARLFEVVDVLSLLGYPFHVPSMPQVQGSIDELLRLSACQPMGWRRRGAALVTEVILQIAQERPNLLHPMGSPLAVKAFKVLRPALQFVEDHLSDKVSVAEMAQLVMCSQRHLRRLFHQMVGMTPKRWLLERRLQRAATLLTQTDLPVKTVAAECGFDDLPHFNRTFRQRFGQSPTQYRRAALKAL